jgi:hypothetical protein
MERFGTPNANALTPRQVSALPHLASAPSLTEGARNASIGRTTLNRWMDDPAFRAQLTQLRENTADLTHAATQGVIFKAVQVIAESLDSPNPFIRLRAVRIAISVALRTDEAREIIQRMDVLDESLTLLKQQR